MTRFRTGYGTKAYFGPECMAELRANLWAIDCQTCGGRFLPWQWPSLVAEAGEDEADASLHHNDCRPPISRDGAAADSWRLRSFPHVTWRAKLVMLPTDRTPVFLVNPSCELARLRKRDGRWRVSTLEEFDRYGMGTGIADGVITQPALSAVVGDDEISVRISGGEYLEHEWSLASAGPAVRALLDSREWLTVAVTTAIDPRRNLKDNPLPRLVDAGQVRLAAAAIGHSDDAQTLRKSDYPGDARIELIAISLELLRRATGIEAGEDVVTAAIACSVGDYLPMVRLAGEAKLLSAFVIALMYATRSRDSDGEPVPGGGVHLMFADEADADAGLRMLRSVGEVTGRTIARLARRPTPEDRRREYLADIVVGAPEQFAAAYEFYRDDREDWSLQQGRGRLAMLIGPDVKDRAGDVLRRYPRVVDV